MRECACNGREVTVAYLGSTAIEVIGHYTGRSYVFSAANQRQAVSVADAEKLHGGFFAIC